MEKDDWYLCNSPNCFCKVKAEPKRNLDWFSLFLAVKGGFILGFIVALAMTGQMK